MPAWFDGRVDSNGECGVATLQRFRAPQSAGSNAVVWYTFALGSVTVVTLSSEHSSAPDSAQGQFLERTLAAVDRSLTPWVVVTHHRHMYDAAGVETEVQAGFLAWLEPVFARHGVDLVLMGHLHSAQRTCQVFNGTCTKGAPMYVISGASGATFGDWPVDPARASWVEYYDTRVNGFQVIDALNRTHLRIRFVRNHDMAVGDEAWVVKQ